MAIRFSPMLLRKLPCFSTSLNSSPPSLSAATISPITEEEEVVQVVKQPGFSSASTKNYSIRNLDDIERLFSPVSTVQLLKSSLNLHMAAFDSMVDLGTWVMKSRLMETVIFREIILAVVKHTFYEHFCAGENVEEASRTLQRLWDNGLRGFLDKELEDAVDNESCDRNLQDYLNTVESTKFLPLSSVSFAIVKITAICPIKLLERVSDLLRWEQKDPSLHLPWKTQTFPMLSESSPLYHTLKRPDPLTTEEEQDQLLAQQRLTSLCKKCLEINLPLLVDAEYSSVQPAIDYFTYSAAIKFNKDENPIVFGTIQAYLKDAKQRMVQAMEAAEKFGISMGFKLVRGAYISSERQIASSLGFASPIHGSIQETHACYNDCTSFMLEKVASGSGAVVLATHNLESGRMAAAKAQSLGIGKANHRLQFAQLKGMAEGLSFGLRNAGFQVSKCLPFGPVEKVIPYLLRRAEENRGLLSSSTLDRQLMSMELKRRLKVAILGREID
ncbi:proline dehydrogenase 2, mitochondrial-like [Telopea speciosissima]|uniref:proline dehydrogenase 2, mitochondrial-like n=1 Tax=Telopea speciosissima TaxID=54955 RepID=UPI001CC6C194|nr:proline dehydrogenase 2, mitochondrial-like [Telopea speciosissima]